MCKTKMRAMRLGRRREETGQTSKLKGQASISQLLRPWQGHCSSQAGEMGNFLSSHGLCVSLCAVKCIYTWASESKHVCTFSSVRGCQTFSVCGSKSRSFRFFLSTHKTVFTASSTREGLFWSQISVTTTGEHGCRSPPIPCSNVQAAFSFMFL